MSQEKIEAKNLLPMIKSAENSFTKTEKRLAQIVMQEPKQVMHTSITELSTTAKVGEATIIRFCRKMGFKGYQGFKMALAQAVSITEEITPMYIEEKIQRDDAVDVMYDKLSASYCKALQDTKMLLDAKNVMKAVGAISQSRKLRFYGTALSGLAAMEAKYKFMLAGMDIDSYIDGHIMQLDAANVGQGDVVLGISHLNIHTDTEESLKIAKEKGATTIAITPFHRSPITNYADIVLITANSKEIVKNGAFIVKVCQLYIVDVLYTEVMREQKSLD